MGLFGSNRGNDDSSADSPDEKPWNKFPDAKTAKKIAEAAAKKDPKEKNDEPKPKKGGWW